MFGEVPVLPVVVPLGGAVLVVALWHLHRQRMLSASRAAVALALGVYAAGIVANTVFPIYLDKPSSPTRWTQFLNLMPGGGYELADAAMNVCVFVPLGVLLSLAAPRWPWWRVLAAAAAVSLFIELTQYVTANLLAGGHIADVNDLASNVVGAGAGLLLLAALSRVPIGARLLARFRWCEPQRTHQSTRSGSPALPWVSPEALGSSQGRGRTESTDCQSCAWSRDCRPRHERRRRSLPCRQRRARGRT